MNGYELAKLLIAAGFTPRSYSGRAMFGRQCVGTVTGASQAAVKVTLEVVNAALLTRKDTAYMQDLFETLTDVRTDNMGLDMIVYWPNVAWQESGDPGDGDDEPDIAA